MLTFNLKYIDWLNPFSPKSEHDFPDSDDDHEIIGKIKRGNRKAYAILVKRYRDIVFNFAFGMCRQQNIPKREAAQIATEIVIDVFFEVWERRREFRKKMIVAAYLGFVAYEVGRQIILDTTDESPEIDLSYEIEIKY